MLSEYGCSHVSIEEMTLQICLFSCLSLLPSDGNDDGRRITPANNLEAAANARKLPKKNSLRPKYMIIAEIQQENTFWKNPLERHVSLSEWK